MIIVTHHLEPGRSAWKQSNITTGNWVVLHRPANSNNILAVNDSNQLYYSNNSGRAWQSLNVTFSSSIKGMFTVRIRVQNVYVYRTFAYGDELYYSDTGGATWTQVSGVGDIEAMTSIYVSSGGFLRLVIGGAALLGYGSQVNLAYSDDGGLTWTACTAAGSATIPKVYSLITYNSDANIAAGTEPVTEGTFPAYTRTYIWTSNNGIQFGKSNTSVGTSSIKSILYVYNPSTRWIISDAGIKYGSSPTGSFTATNITSGVWFLYRVSATKMLAVNTSDASVLLSSDNGTTWQSIEPLKCNCIMAIEGNNESRLVAGGSGYKPGLWYSDPEDVSEEKEISFITKAGVQEFVTQAKQYIDSL